MKIKFEWESIYDNTERSDDFFEETYRAKIQGGWLIRHETMNDFNDSEEVKKDGWQTIENSMVFVPDPNHEWEIE